MDGENLKLKLNVAQFYLLFLRHLSVASYNYSHAGHIKQAV